MEMTHRQKVNIICLSIQDNCEPKILQKPFVRFSRAQNQNSFKIIVLAYIASTSYIQRKRDPGRGLAAMEAFAEKRGTRNGVREGKTKVTVEKLLFATRVLN